MTYFLLGLLCAWLLRHCSYDDSDEPKVEGKKRQRSGLIVYTDYKTGVQYLSSWTGVLTPRLDKEGKPL